MDKYSIVIYPSEAVITLVKTMKEDLAKELGWFHSKNSVGHITICLFKATDTSINSVKEKLQALCTELRPVKVWINDFGSYPNGAFYVEPDAISKKLLKPIMTQVQDTLSYIPNLIINEDPHLSIARRLSPSKLQRAKSLFKLIDIHFLCDSFVLRKFDDKVKQYIVTDTYNFGFNP